MGGENIEISVGYDGSCPQSMKAVVQRENSITVYPSRRKGGEGISEEAKGAGSRFDIEIINNNKNPKEITLTVDWEDIEKKRIESHDYVFTKHEIDEDWNICCGYTRGGMCIVKLILKQGKTIVCQNPRYNYQDYENFVKQVSKDHFVRKELAGKSEEGRNIWLLKVTDDISEDKKQKVMVVAMNHAYESAGSYCVEGMLDFLLSNDQWAKYFISKFIFYFMPMTNPDGVHNGLSRLTSPNGADLNRVVTVSDKAHQVIKETLDKVTPSLFINIHNWISKYIDGLLCLDKNFAEKVKFFMPAQIEYGKKWYVETLEEWVRKTRSSEVLLASQSWKDYCKEQFNSTGVTFEFPWFGRNGSIMKQTGAKTLRASILAFLNKQG